MAKREVSEKIRAQYLLIQRARKGDEDAFDLLMKPHRGSIRAAISRTLNGLNLNGINVDDLEQISRLNISKALPRFDRNKASFSTWVFTIAKRKTIDEIKKRKHENWESIDDLSYHGDENAGQLGILQNLERNKRVEMLRLRMTPRQRKITDLLLDGWEFTDILVELGISRAL